MMADNKKNCGSVKMNMSESKLNMYSKFIEKKKGIAKMTEAHEERLHLYT